MCDVVRQGTSTRLCCETALESVQRKDNTDSADIWAVLGYLSDSYDIMTRLNSGNGGGLVAPSLQAATSGGLSEGAKRACLGSVKEFR